MKNLRTFLIITIGLIFVLLAGASIYAVLRDDDPYRSFTGLGESISVSPDDSKIAFSYYLDGEESIYIANPNGTHSKKITNPNNHRDRHPKYSPDSKQLVYLSKGPEGVQTLQVINEDGSKGRQLTDSEIHVTEAIFSKEGKSIFFVAMKAEDFNTGGESTGGFDLF